MLDLKCCWSDSQDNSHNSKPNKRSCLFDKKVLQILLWAFFFVASQPMPFLVVLFQVLHVEKVDLHRGLSSLNYFFKSWLQFVCRSKFVIFLSVWFGFRGDWWVASKTETLMATPKSITWIWSNTTHHSVTQLLRHATVKQIISLTCRFNYFSYRS